MRSTRLKKSCDDYDGGDYDYDDADSDEDKVRGFRAIKIRSPPSFGGEVKPSAPFREILRHVIEPFDVRKRYFIPQNVLLPSPVPLA
jgi:hypothetical protein